MKNRNEKMVLSDKLTLIGMIITFSISISALILSYKNYSYSINKDKVDNMESIDTILTSTGNEHAPEYKNI